MAVLRKRGKKYYIDMYVNGNREHIALGTGNKADATLILEKIRSDTVLGKFDIKNLKKEVITLEDFFCKYFAFAESFKKPATIRNEKFYARKFVEHVENRNLRDINVQILDNWKAEMLKHYAPASFNIQRRFLHAAFNTAIKWEYVTTNPFSKISKLRVDERRMFLTVDELRRIIAIIDHDVEDPTKQWNQTYNKKFRLFVEFLFFTGLRRQEALSLCWNDVDLAGNKILLEKTKGKTFRSIPMLPPVRVIVLSLGEILFHDLEASSVSHKFKSICKRAGIGDGFKLHSLRHTFATTLLESGSDIASVQNLLGHADIRTTLIYGKATSELLRKEIDKLLLPTNNVFEPSDGYNLVTVYKTSESFLRSET